MKKVGLVISFALLFVLLAFALPLAQMEMGKGGKHEIEVKMMGEGMMSHGKCGQPCGGMMHQMGCCQMGQGMMMGGMSGCSKMGGGMKMCGMMRCEGEMSCGGKGFFLCCKKELELTDEQIKALKSIKMDFLKGELKKGADLKIAHLELKALMDDDKASLKEIEAKLKSAHKLKTDLKLSHIKALREAKALLTPEQKEKVKKCHEM